MTAPWRKIRKDIQSYANSYVLAVSGGVDSMFLLDFMTRCDTHFVVAHVNHGLRPESAQEQELVLETARKLGLRTFTTTLSGLEQAPSIEAEARKQRYAFLSSVRDEVNADRVITAHHSNDQVETILLRLMRGHPHNSLAMKKDNGLVYRPLLEVSKAEILDSALHRGLLWFEDQSNSCNDFERNWVRNVILPQMNERRNVLNTIIDGLHKTSFHAADESTDIFDSGVTPPSL